MTHLTLQYKSPPTVGVLHCTIQPNSCNLPYCTAPYNPLLLWDSCNATPSCCLHCTTLPAAPSPTLHNGLCILQPPYFISPPPTLSSTLQCPAHHSAELLCLTNANCKATQNCNVRPIGRCILSSHGSAPSPTADFTVTVVQILHTITCSSSFQYALNKRVVTNNWEHLYIHQVHLLVFSG